MHHPDERDGLRARRLAQKLLAIVLLIASVLRLEAANEGIVRGVPVTACAPRPTDFTYLWWANGWLDGAPREPALLCLQTGNFGAVIDPAKADVVRLGVDPEKSDYAALATSPATEPDRVQDLPRAALALTATLGTNVFRCVAAATNRKDWMNFPVRIVESGRFVQRFDVLQLAFEDAAGNRLDGVGRLEVTVWPDVFTLELEVTTPAALGDLVASVDLEAAAPIGRRRGQSLGAAVTAGERMSRGRLVVQVPDSDGRAPRESHVVGNPPENVGPAGEGEPSHPTRTGAGDGLAIGVTDSPSAQLCPVAFDATHGWYRVALPAKAWRVAEEPDRLDRFRVTLTNALPHEQVVRLLFDDASGTPAITGLTPMLRTADGIPTGIPVQTSKNWHRQPDRRLRYEGPWLHAFTMLRLPPQSRTEAEYAITFARWGGVPAASHAQLCLIGWGWNQLWDQAAIGSWGESICYEPDAIQMRCRVDDVRPLMVWGMGAGQKTWTWTHNVGGGDFLVYDDGDGRYQPWRAVRTTYRSQGPNLTEVIYSGVTADGAIACRVRVATPRTDDVNRAYHHLRYEVLKPTRFRRLAFYQLGSDRYHWHQYGRLARGDAAGLAEEWDPGRGGKRYLRTGIPCTGDAPWFSLHDGVARDGRKPVEGAWATRGLIVRSWKARLGGRAAPPFASVYGTEAGGVPSANLELSAPPNVTELQPGDFVDAEVEFVVLPMVATDYYGPNASLRAALPATANTWRAVHRQAAGNTLQVIARRGHVQQAYPLVVAVDRRQLAEIDVTGGLGYVPIRFTGVRNPGGFRLSVDERDGRGPQAVDQAVHGHDFWQAERDPRHGTWALTFNLPLDTPQDERRERRIRFEGLRADTLR